MTVAVGAAASALSIKAQAAETCENPDFEEMKNRMLNVSERGKGLSTEQKYFVLLATSAAQALPVEAKAIAAAAIKAGVTPIAITEAVIQTSPYVGVGHVEAILPAVNEALKEAGVKLPLESQVTVNDENRLEKGIEVQVSIFGDYIKEMHKNAPKGQEGIIINDLSGWCFGDFYTRKGMSIKDRELVVFAAIASLGGCETQLTIHENANINEGNSRQDLVDAIQIAAPLNGFPRTLNALAVVNNIK
ncbi:MAG: carboxymuconolactone decarboxylase family protein [Burkholderiales bacterium]|nr:carboxymuconolactone decarboxylase family protein [Burkholderiales bacterium]